MTSAQIRSGQVAPVESLKGTRRSAIVNDVRYQLWTNGTGERSVEAWNADGFHKTVAYIRTRSRTERDETTRHLKTVVSWEVYRMRWRARITEDAYRSDVAAFQAFVAEMRKRDEVKSRPRASESIVRPMIGNAVDYKTPVGQNGFGRFEACGVVVYDDGGLMQVEIDGEKREGVFNIIRLTHTVAGYKYATTLDGELLGTYRTLGEAAGGFGV